MRLTTLLTLALIALVPASAVAAINRAVPIDNTDPTSKLGEGCITREDLNIRLLVAAGTGDTVARTVNRDEIFPLVVASNKEDGPTMDPDKIVEVILVRAKSGDKMALIFAEKDQACVMFGGSTEFITKFLFEAYGKPA
jgi:hypothetical protein